MKIYLEGIIEKNGKLFMEIWREERYFSKKDKLFLKGTKIVCNNSKKWSKEDKERILQLKKTDLKAVSLSVFEKIGEEFSFFDTKDELKEKGEFVEKNGFKLERTGPEGRIYWNWKELSLYYKDRFCCSIKGWNSMAYAVIKIKRKYESKKYIALI